MTRTTKKDYMSIVHKRYFKSSKKEKSKIIDEVCDNLNIHRKSAIRLINGIPPDKGARRQPRACIYSKHVIWIIEELWKLTEYPCGIILKASIPLWIKHLKLYYPIDADTQRMLFSISSSTIDRRLRYIKRRIKRKIYGRTKPGHIIRSQIPIRCSSSGVTKPGSLELDTVAHCGHSSSGEFIYTVNSVDIATCWVSRRATLGKGQFAVKGAIDEITKKLPFKVLDMDFDNGDEFLNWNLIDYCKRNSIGFTRSRPYKKDDQAHIEQKNSTHVRRVFGRLRLDKPEVAQAMNDLYSNELCIYHNFFRPAQKLLYKKVIGSKLKRKFDKTQTPYQRVLSSEHVSKNTKKRLTDKFDSINPIELKGTIDRKIKAVFALQYRKAKHAAA
ncbi:integrase [Candidatus Omnitrophota bacterium]